MRNIMNTKKVVLLMIIMFGVGINLVLAQEKQTLTKEDVVVNEQGVIVKKLKDIKGHIIIPASIGGVKVIAVGDKAFKSCLFLKSVEMKSVKRVGAEAFYGCSSLISVNMPAVASIKEKAFEVCSGLKDIIAPNVTEIGNLAFSGCIQLNDEDKQEIVKVNRKALSLELPF